MPKPQNIAILGLGYVGLPLAVALGKSYRVIGFDVDHARIAELHEGHDRTGEVGDSDLKSSTCRFTADPAEIAGAHIFIVTVPTPVDEQNKPDLSAVLAACGTVGAALAKSGAGPATVVFESTVYPGVTEDICGPEIERTSGLTCGRDFFLGYSPERINPGDREHTVETLTKVVAGQTPEVAEQLSALYGSITRGGTFLARNIKTAEAAKVIENAQRDINIAFMNEVAMIFRAMNISIYDVLEAAETKWNFLKFTPGLVGGHCIGVDPFYLAHGAQEHGHNPEIILAGRRINDEMGRFLAKQIMEASERNRTGQSARILVLGLTFKEDVPDLRNTKVVDIIDHLRNGGHAVDVHDPVTDPADAKRLYGLDLLTNLSGIEPYDVLIGAVPHRSYREFTAETFAQLVKPGGLVADFKQIWHDTALPPGQRRWRL